MAVRAQQHDSLHPTPENGLTNCWCLKPCCWADSSPTLPRDQRGRARRDGRGAGRRTGYCICLDCPCPHSGPPRGGLLPIMNR